MRLPLAAALTALLALTGCSTMASYFDDAPADPVVAEAPPAPVAAAPAAAGPQAWCMQVAADMRLRAVTNGFDTPTQERMTLTAYNQCLLLENS